MKVRVDIFKKTGKWYDGGLVEIGDAELWHPEFKQNLIKNHEIVDSFRGFYIVVSDDPDEYAKPGYRKFYRWLYKPGDLL